MLLHSWRTSIISSRCYLYSSIILRDLSPSQLLLRNEDTGEEHDAS